MQPIPLVSIRTRKTCSFGFVPDGVNVNCPHCETRVTMTLRAHIDDGHRHAVSASASCPECTKEVAFWALFKNDATVGKKHPYALYMNPASSNNYVHEDLGEDVPEKLLRSFVSTVDSFRTANYPATVTGARRTLEGVFKYRVPESDRGKNLFQLIEQVSTDPSLARPLTTLAHAVRSGGNLGAHFDEDREPTQQMAKQAVELLNYLIKYLYVLPREIEKLEESMRNNPEASAQS